MSQSMVEIAKELTLALVETGNMPPEDMQDDTSEDLCHSYRAQSTGRVRRLNPCHCFQDSASGLAKEHHQTGGDLSGVRPSLQAIIPPPSGDTRTGQPFVPDEVRYSADPTAFRSIDD